MTDLNSFRFKDAKLRHSGRRQLYMPCPDSYVVVAAFVSAMTGPWAHDLREFPKFVKQELEDRGQTIGGLYYVSAIAHSFGKDIAKELLSGGGTAEQNLAAIDLLLELVEEYEETVVR